MILECRTGILELRLVLPTTLQKQTVRTYNTKLDISIKNWNTVPSQGLHYLSAYLKKTRQNSQEKLQHQTRPYYLKWREHLNNIHY